jgi:hypothetical protein
VSVYSTRFFYGACPNSPTELYVVPATQVLVLRDVEYYNSSAGEASMNLQLYVSGLEVATIFRVVNLAAGTTGQWQGRTVLNPTDGLGATQSNPGAFYFLASGYLLDM